MHLVSASRSGRLPRRRRRRASTSPPASRSGRRAPTSTRAEQIARDGRPPHGFTMTRAVDRRRGAIRADPVRSQLIRCDLTAPVTSAPEAPAVVERQCSPGCKPLEPRVPSKAPIRCSRFLLLLALRRGHRRRGARMPRQPVTAASAIKLDGELSEEVWQKAPVVIGLQAARSERGRRGHLRDGSARRLRRHRDLRRRPGASIPSPSRIVGIRTRRDESSPSDWIRVMIDSFHDRRSAYEFARQSRPASSRTPTGSTTPTTTRAGTRCGTWPVSRNDRGWRAEFRMPFSQLRFHPAADRDLRAWPSSGRSAASTKPTTWPLLARSATGFVSSFGELTGLQLGAVAEAARAGALRRRRRDHAAGRGRQPAAASHRSRARESASI